MRVFLPQLCSEFYPEVVLHGCNLNMPFYELDEVVRLAMTYSAIASRSTVSQRWQALKMSEADGWNARAAAAAAMLAGCGRIVDLGCGTMLLEQHLPKSVDYVPVDVVRRDACTVVIDFNGAPIDIGGDGAAMLGLLEYIIDPEKLLASCRKNFKTLVVSYNCASEFAPRAERRKHAWVNDFTEAQIETLFSASKFTTAEKRQIDASETLWKLV